jgi:hypothetical protein
VSNLSTAKPAKCHDCGRVIAAGELRESVLVLAPVPATTHPTHWAPRRHRRVTCCTACARKRYGLPDR